jgi:hypothetical protein
MNAAPRSCSLTSRSAAAVAVSTLLCLLGLLGALVLAGCGADSVSPDNRPPVLVSLSASPEAVAVGDACTITARATDPDGDELVYEWAAEPGFVTGGGREVSLTAASCCFGGNTVLVTVKDGRGGETKGMIVVGVGE